MSMSSLLALVCLVSLSVFFASPRLWLYPCIYRYKTQLGRGRTLGVSSLFTRA